MLDIFYYFIKNTVSLSRRDLCLPHQHPISTHASWREKARTGQLLISLTFQSALVLKQSVSCRWLSELS